MPGGQTHQHQHHQGHPHLDRQRSLPYPRPSRPQSHQMSSPGSPYRHGGVTGQAFSPFSMSLSYCIISYPTTPQLLKSAYTSKPQVIQELFRSSDEISAFQFNASLPKVAVNPRSPLQAQKRLVGQPKRSNPVNPPNQVLEGWSWTTPQEPSLTICAAAHACTHLCLVSQPRHVSLSIVTTVDKVPVLKHSIPSNKQNHFIGAYRHGSHRAASSSEFSTQPRPKRTANSDQLSSPLAILVRHTHPSPLLVGPHES